ncbi:MAG: rhodanese-like domain-containing protein [Marinosulfonomonas sp.]|nr:rhodanese-like domain-containing protein [Marinosulfonomonas sp.]
MQGQVTTPNLRHNRRGFLIGAISAIVSLTAMPAMAAETTIGAADAYVAAKTGKIILVDIRTPEEWAGTGIGEGAIALDMTEKSFVDSLVKLRTAYPQTPIALICRTGNRSGYVFKALDQQGFTGLVDVSEGMAGGRNGKGWIPRGLPTYAGTKAEIETRQNVALSR